MATAPILTPRNQSILTARLAAFNARPATTPRVGDAIRYPDGHIEYVSHDWDDSVQTSLCGRFYLGDDYLSFSGALNPSVPVALLTPTTETLPLTVWFFSDNEWRAHNGIDVDIDVRVFNLGIG